MNIIMNSEKEQFILESNGIWDTYKDNKKPLTWGELCDTLNELDKYCSENLNDYEHIIKLEHKIKKLEFKLHSVQELLVKVKDYIQDIDIIIDNE